MKNKFSIIISLIVGCVAGIIIGVNFWESDSTDRSVLELENGIYDIVGDWGDTLEATDDTWIIGENTFKVIYSNDNTVFLIGDKNNLVYNAKRNGNKTEFRKITKDGIVEPPVATIEKQ